MRNVQDLQISPKISVFWSGENHSRYQDFELLCAVQKTKFDVEESRTSWPMSSLMTMLPIFSRSWARDESEAEDVARCSTHRDRSQPATS